MIDYDGIALLTGQFNAVFLGVLPIVMRCYLQGINEAPEMLGYIKEDLEFNYLFFTCHCHGQNPGCQNCQDQIDFTQELVEFIELFICGLHLDADTLAILQEQDLDQNRAMEIILLSPNRLGVRYVDNDV